MEEKILAKLDEMGEMIRQENTNLKKELEGKLEKLDEKINEDVNSAFVYSHEDRIGTLERARR